MPNLLTSLPTWAPSSPTRATFNPISITALDWRLELCDRSGNNTGATSPSASKPCSVSIRLRYSQSSSTALSAGQFPPACVPGYARSTCRLNGPSPTPNGSTSKQTWKFDHTQNANRYNDIAQGHFRYFDHLLRFPSNSSSHAIYTFNTSAGMVDALWTPRTRWATSSPTTSNGTT